MSKPIITIQKVSKKYPLYKKRWHRVLATLGFPLPERYWSEFWALRDIDLTIQPGERLGLIGRNGAGKSTLLKIVSGVAQPSVGKVTVNGKIQALMELGTGFHPDFTGRQNIFAALSYQGIIGKQAQKMFDEIVDFSELDEFIDKPLKTYSSGMSARLSFSVATAITPEILVIDEILGAGDAYFAAKSTERMKQLTSQGATVLFVSHDISAVQMLCNRAIWIERGTIIQEGNPIEVGKSYAASIRKQEEYRLRAVNLKLKQSHSRHLFSNTSVEASLLGRLVCFDEAIPQEQHPISKIILHYGENELDSLAVGYPQDDSSSERMHLLTTQGYMNWSEPKKINDRWIRCFSNEAGEYRHAPFVFKVPLGYANQANFNLTIHHAKQSAETVLVQIYDGTHYVTIGELHASANESASPEWQQQQFALPEYLLKSHATTTDTADANSIVVADAPLPSDTAIQHSMQQQTIDVRPIYESTPFEMMNHTEYSANNFPSTIAQNVHDDDTLSDIYGSKEAEITSIEFTDNAGQSCRVFEFGSALNAHIGWYSPQDIEQLSFVITLYGLDGHCVCQVFSQPLNVKANQRGNVVASLNPLLLGRGEYIVSLGIFQYLSLQDRVGHYPIEVHDRKYHIKILPPANIHIEYGQIVHPVKWSLHLIAN